MTWANRVKLGGAQNVSGRRQPWCGDTSRMNREVHVRICEGLGVKFPGPTRQSLPKSDVRVTSVYPSISDMMLRRREPTLRTTFRLSPMTVVEEAARTAARTSTIRTGIERKACLIAVPVAQSSRCAFTTQCRLLSILLFEHPGSRQSCTAVILDAFGSRLVPSASTSATIS